MKKLLSTLFLAAVAFTAAAQNFEDLFDSFAKESSKDYAAFYDEANKRFVNLLNESWIEFKVLEGIEYPRKPKPKVQPVAPTAPVGPSVSPVRTPDPAEAPASPDTPDTTSAPEYVRVWNPSPVETDPPVVNVADTPDCEANGVKPCIFDFYNSEVTVLQRKMSLAFGRSCQSPITVMS